MSHRQAGTEREGRGDREERGKGRDGGEEERCSEWRREGRKEREEGGTRMEGGVKRLEGYIHRFRGMELDMGRTYLQIKSHPP